jgi:hypothetical protein
VVGFAEALGDLGVFRDVDEQIGESEVIVEAVYTLNVVIIEYDWCWRMVVRAQVGLGQSNRRWWLCV